MKFIYYMIRSCNFPKLHEVYMIHIYLNTKAHNNNQKRCTLTWIAHMDQFVIMYILLLNKNKMLQTPIKLTPDHGGAIIRTYNPIHVI